MRTHLGLPTPEEIENGVPFYSDHLPIYWRVNLKEPTGNLPEVPTLNVMSQNVLGDVSCSGLHTFNLRDSEDQEKQFDRYNKMAESLSRAAKTHNVSVILLQEVPQNFSISYLQDSLGKEWAIENALIVGMISCYRTTQLELIDDAELDDAQRIHTLYLKDTKTNQTISISNIWGIFSPVPFYGVEQRFIDVLTKSTADIAILGGDTNSRIAPISATPQNIVTTNVPYGMIALQDENWKGQLSDFPDGAFVRTQDRTIRQLENFILDLDSSEFIKDKREKIDRHHYPRFRLVIHIDNEALQQPLINKQTRDIYQSYLRTELDQTIYVQPAANDNNEKGLALSFQEKSNAYLFIKSQVSKDIPDAQIECLSIDNTDTPVTFYTIIVSQENANELHYIITKYIFIAKTLTGIINHQNNVSNQFSYLFFDNKKDKSRAIIYKSALESSDYSFENKLILVFSLLVSNDGKNLKDSVARALGAASLEMAKYMTLNKIKQYSCASTNSEISLDEIYKQVAQIVKITNSPPKVLPDPPSSLLKNIFENEQERLLESRLT